ncbi:GerAB/ArcD/ProY family transporter [Paenibacillus arenilitoris]|uniref:GerAB/ArcD/ProY family transporter n=1 Tax=Paenibacillus arenilitoris TaxID=2772299 RepID=A0A927CTG7_9BACL|nr:GerAB/ArcD/ProY family transporter [Paenibacillus arenilitoris]MBD2872932.1 GerAB/ArcD/ProY family transporter [Paenibacillus arenilitoris]
MREQETVSSGQMAVLFYVFMIGSSVIALPGPVIGFAKNGAWLSLILTAGFGTVLLYCTLYLYNKHPDLTFVEYSQKTVGTWVTAILVVPFLTVATESSMGIIQHMGIFLKTSMMRETPLYVFHAFIYITIAMTLRAGIEVMARLFFLLTVFMVLFILTVLLLATPEYHPAYMLPFLPQGFKPVLHGVYATVGFPYAELIFFTMLLPFVRQAEIGNLPKKMYVALWASTMSMVFVTVSTIMTFGPIAGERKYSVFEIARIIEVQEIIQRIESLIGISLILGSYMKATLSMYVLNIGLSRLLRLSDDRLLIFPLALIHMLASIISVESDNKWVEIVHSVVPLWFFVGAVIPLLILTAVTVVKTSRRRNNS